MSVGDTPLSGTPWEESKFSFGGLPVRLLDTQKENFSCKGLPMILESGVPSRRLTTKLFVSIRFSLFKFQ